MILQMITPRFDEIFPDYDTFKDYTDDLGLTRIGVDDDINYFLFRAIYYQFADNYTNYDLIDNFKRRFAVVYIDNFEKFKNMYTTIGAIYSLSLDDLKNNGIILNNFAKKPEAIDTTAFEPLNYVVNQNANISYLDELQAYLRSINSIPTRHLGEFLENFKFLFQTILYDDEYLIYKGV